MKYFDYLETIWVEAQKRLKVAPENLQPTDQAKMLAAQALIDKSRKMCTIVYFIGYFVRYIGIRLHLIKAPAYKSSIPPKAPPKPTSPILVQSEKPLKPPTLTTHG